MQKAAKTSATGADRTRPLVLVIEDDPAIRRLLDLSLTRLGLEVKAVADGESGLAFLETHAVDLVCLDLMLPNQSGFEVCEAIRKSSKNAGSPVLIITSRTEPDAQAFAEEAGANGFLLKPFRRADLEAQARRLLRPVPAVRA